MPARGALHQSFQRAGRTDPRALAKHPKVIGARKVPVLAIGASTGLFGAVWAQAELRKVLATAGADVLDRELVISDAPGAFDDHGRLVDNAVRADLESIVVELREASAAKCALAAA